MTLLKRSWIFALLAILGFAPQGVLAQVQSLSVGYTDANLIIAQLPEYRTVMEQLQRLAEGGQAEYEQLIQDFQTELNDYQKKQALLSPEARTAREERLAAQQGDIQSFLQDKEQELGQRELELLSPLLEKVQTAINDVAEERGIDLVLSAQSAGNPVILYADQEMDITPMVMDKLGIEPPTADSASQ